MGWTSLLSSVLMTNAYRHGGEIGCPKQDTLSALKILRSNGFSIIGIDTLNIKDSIVSPLCDDWDPDSIGFVPDYPKTPEDFVETFPWQSFSPGYQGMIINFMITVDGMEV